MKLGADEYIEKPVDLPELLEKIRSVEEKMARDEDVVAVEEAVEESRLPLKIIAESQGMKDVISIARRVSKSPFSVLIQGETGTGKNLIAQAIHANSLRKQNSYIVVDCASLNENLLETELFGHTKGAYTGADRAREGAFKVCDKGLLFLDEIGELPDETQALLLRAISPGEAQAVGSNESYSTKSVTIIGATDSSINRLKKPFEIRIGQKIIVPSLNERPEDVPGAICYFAKK
jgi:DNA-binding NtrC family response regulator